MASPIPPPVPVPGSLGAPRLRERIRAALDQSWLHEQDGADYQVFHMKDYDELRHAITELLEVTTA